jgi:hypothetical protein
MSPAKKQNSKMGKFCCFVVFVVFSKNRMFCGYLVIVIVVVVVVVVFVVAIVVFVVVVVLLLLSLLLLLFYHSFDFVFF